MRALPGALHLAFMAALAACDSSSPGGGNTQTSVPPSGCPAEPCTAGAVCFAPAEPSCGGTWYCWADTVWRCAPPDSGGGGGPPDASPGDDASEAAAPDAPAD